MYTHLPQHPSTAANLSSSYLSFVSHSPAMHTALFLVDNIHCPSCISLITDILSKKDGVAADVQVSLIQQTVRVSFDEDVINHRAISTALAGAAFDVQHVTVFNAQGAQVDDQNLKTISDQDSPRWSRMWHRAQKNHIENCDACQREQAQMSGIKSKAKTWATIVRTRRLSTSASAPSSAPGTAAAVDRPLVLNVDGPAPPEDSITYTASLAIEGMTCGVCIGTITRGVQDLPFVSSVNIDLLTNSGTFEIRGKSNVTHLIENIQDLGYEASLVTLAEPDTALRPSAERLVEIEISGMHCNHCPARVRDALAHLAETSPAEGKFKVLKLPSLSEPKTQIAYQPARRQDWTVRRFISAIQAVDPAFYVQIYHPPTLEEHSHRIQHLERMSILRRLIFTGIVAIPSFIIGVVFMALVPKHNTNRMWLEQPIWAGNASRIEWALFIMTTPVMFYGADLFHRRASKEIWQMWKPGSSFPLLKRFYRFGSMNLLISAATTVAYLSSLAVLVLDATGRPGQHSGMSNTYFDAVTFLTFFILIGRFLEAYSKAKTGDAVTLLGKLRPSEAYLVDEGIQKVAVDQLELDDIVQVPRGHSPPADGVVEQDGTFSFDESSLTGESKPVKKAPGDTVYTGTVNLGDPVEIKVTQLGGTSVLDQIINVVRGGQSKRAPIERFADVLTGFFVPVITFLAVTTWLVWLVLGLSGALPEAWLNGKRGGWPFWSLDFAIAVFVIACPCGIGLAAPTALFVGGGLAAKQGILVQGGGQAFQEASKLTTVVFDKTGTLTAGQMMVTDYEQLSDAVSKDVVLAVTKHLEGLSSHPIAQAIVSYCTSTAAEVTLSDVQELPGQGMAAKVVLRDGSREEIYHAAIGNESLLASLNSSPTARTEKPSLQQSSAAPPSQFSLQQALLRHQTQGHSIAIVALRRQSESIYHPTALFSLSDPLRPEAPAVIAKLRARGLSVHMCTGDNPTTASAIAAQLSIPTTHVRAGVLPGGKAEYVHELQHPRQLSPTDSSVSQRRHIVAFVGDGLNDTPALAAADVSISPSTGSDIAVNAASFILLSPDLHAITKLIALSQRVFLRVKLNFFWAAVYNGVLIPVAAGVFFPIGASPQQPGWRLGPVWAALAMACSSVSVVVSSLALRLPEVKVGRFLGRKGENDE